MFSSSRRCAPTSTGSRRPRMIAPAVPTRESKANQQNRKSSRGPPRFLRQPPASPYERQSLLDGSLCAGVLELLLDRFGIRLRNAFLDRRRSTLDQVLRLLEAQARDLADDLDHAHLVGAELGHGHGELGLGFRRRGRRGRAATGSRRYGSGRRNIELLLHV